MKSAAFTYHDPTTLDEAVALLASLEDTKIIAGGQSLMPMMNMRFVQPEHLIDLNAIGSINGIEETPDGIRIGAMTRQKDLLKSPLLKSKIPIMAEAVHWVGHFQTRNRGTIGGSLCHLDPAAEIPVIASLYDAQISVEGSEGKHVIPFSQWPLAYMMPSIALEEMVTEIHFSVPQNNHGHAFVEYSRRHGDFAIVAVAALVEIEGETVKSARIAIGGADQIVQRVTAIEDALQGEAASEQTWQAAGAGAASEIETMGDTYASAKYRSRLVRVLVERALVKAAKRAGGQDG